MLRVVGLMSLGLCIAACDSPRPDYTSVQMAPAYRTGSDGMRIDNEHYRLDAEGYRVDKRGRQVGIVDIQAKMAGESSNPVAGYYISTIGADAPGRVATPSEGAGAGPGRGPGSMDPGTTTPTPLAPSR